MGRSKAQTVVLVWFGSVGGVRLKGQVARARCMQAARSMALRPGGVFSKTTDSELREARQRGRRRQPIRSGSAGSRAAVNCFFWRGSMTEFPVGRAGVVG